MDATFSRGFDYTVANAYLDAKALVIEAGFSREIIWQEHLLPQNVSPRSFLCECAWVILNSGMRTSVVANRFSAVCEAFFSFSDTQVILDNSERCIAAAYPHFGHRAKLSAILDAVSLLNNTSIEDIRGSIECHGPIWLAKIPYLGPATAFHLAKNLGFDFAKPDRHLLRMCNNLGGIKPQRLCEIISDVTGDRVSVVDLVLWRYSVMDIQHRTLILDQHRYSQNLDTGPCIANSFLGPRAI